ncbi:MAG: class I SAM-dependent methyltransferase [Betaproteobacteria bacterium]
MLGLLLATPFAGAQAQFKYDVPYVPTPPVVVEEMLRLAAVRADDFVLDLGSGDGRVVIAAATKLGASGIGVELDADLILESEDNAALAGVGDRVSFRREDLFKFDLARATVITLYLVPTINMKLRPRLLNELKPGTRIVSHDFDFGDWKPDARSTVRKNVFLWIVPAKIAGRWRVELERTEGIRSYEVELTQNYQEIDGLVRYGGKVVALWNSGLRGDAVRFTVVDDSAGVDTNLYFEGRVDGGRMEGGVLRGVGVGQQQMRWQATRVDAEGKK